MKRTGKERAGKGNTIIWKISQAELDNLKQESKMLTLKNIMFRVPRTGHELCFL